MNQYMRLKTDGAIAELNQFMANILGCEVANLYTALEGLLGLPDPQKVPAGVRHDRGRDRNLRRLRGGEPAASAGPTTSFL